MPSYDFRCPECDGLFEVTRPAGGANDVCCPDCGVPAKRVFTPVGVVFKGSGFHNTDYRSPGKRDSGSDSSAPKSEKPAVEKSSCGGGDGAGCAGCPAAS